jgi:2-methylcitrate dehydratase
MTAPGTLERLAAWTLEVRAADIPERAVAQAKLLLLDTIGCGLAALNDHSAQAVLRMVESAGGAPQCAVIGHALRTSAANAVLANGALIRVLDLNDYVIANAAEVAGHPSDNIPVALAAGELAGQSGSEIIAAIVLAYDLDRHVKALMGDISTWDGVTASGAVGSAIAGRLMGLDRRRLAHAMALSLARSPTFAAVRRGDLSSAKSLANALVAQNAMQAALLAREDATGPLTLFDQATVQKSVFPKVASLPEADAALSAGSAIMAAHIKVYPCLVTGQSVVAAGLAMHRAVNGQVDRLSRIRVLMPDLAMLRRQMADPARTNPTSHEAADHSFNFLAAVSLVDGCFGLAQYDGERWNDTRVRALMSRIEIATDPDLDRSGQGGFPCAIRAIGTDGQHYAVDITATPGFSQGGLDADLVIAKFQSIVPAHLTRDRATRVIDAVMALDKSPSCGALVEAMSGRAGSGR